jgi:hypothetical protein
MTKVMLHIPSSMGAKSEVEFDFDVTMQVPSFPHSEDDAPNHVVEAREVRIEGIRA